MVPTSALPRLFERLLEVFSLPWDSERSNRLIARVGQDRRLWHDHLAEIGAGLGLSFTPIEVASVDVIGMVGHRSPVVTWGGRGERHWWLLLDRDQSRVLVVSDQAPDGRWMGAIELAAALGAESKATPLLWCTVNLAEPLSSVGHAKSPLARVWELAHMASEDLKVVAIYAVVIGLLSLVTPIAVQSLVNTTAFGTVLQPLVVLILVVVVALGLSAVLSALQVSVVEQIQRRLFVEVVSDLAHRLPRLRPGAFGGDYGPAQLNRFFEVFTIHKSAAALLIEGLGLALTTAVGLILLAFYHPALLAFDLVLIAALALIIVGLGRGTVRTAIDESKTKYQVVAWLQETARANDVFRGSAGRALAFERADRLTRAYLHARASHFRLVLRQNVAAYALHALASGALLGVGGFLVFQGQLTLGQLVAAELIVTSVVSAFSKMGKQLEAFYDLAAAADKLGHLAELPTVALSGECPEAPPPRGSAIRVKNLEVAIDGRVVLGEVNLDVKSGERVVLQGASGSGKTLLAEVLGGRRAETGGHIELDGMDLRDLDEVAHQRRVMLLRPGEVIAGSILDNLRLGDGHVETSKVRQALEKVGILDVVLSLPDGMQTELLPSGAPLSSTQVSALILARACVHRPSMVVADGILDDLDDRALESGVRMLTDHEAPWTLLLITRRSNVGADLPRRLRLDGGRLVEARG